MTIDILPATEYVSSLIDLALDTELVLVSSLDRTDRYRKNALGPYLVLSQLVNCP